jgi:hypothetical protein
VVAVDQIAFGNYATIQSAYQMAGLDEDTAGETPTGESIVQATQILSTVVDPGPKFILLITDGNPDTCDNLNPQCGADRTLAAVQQAKLAGIGTMVVGIGDIEDTCAGRCGADHLQDVANAGMGLPVQPNLPAYLDTACMEGNALEASYAAAGEAPGAAAFFQATTQQQLQESINGLINNVRDCVFTLAEAVRLEVAVGGTVLLDGQPLVYGDPNGWRLNDSTTLEILGNACTSVQTTGLMLDVSFPCDVR